VIIIDLQNSVGTASDASQRTRPGKKRDNIPQAGITRTKGDE
jgi:hypothetical protein